MSRGASFAFARSLVVAGLFSAGTAPAALAAGVTWPDLVVHLHASGRAYLVDPARDAVIAEIETGKGGTLATTTPDGRKVYVGHAGEGERHVTVIDLAQARAVARIETGSRPKHPLASPDGRWVVVNHWGLDDGALRLSFIDTAADTVAQQVAIPVKREPSGVTSMHNAWSYDSRFAYTVDRVDDEFVVVDTTDWSVQEFPLPSKPHYVVPSHDDREVWVVIEGVDVANPPMTVVYARDGAKFTETARIAMPVEDQQAIEGHHGNFTQDGRYFVMLNRGPGKNLLGNKMIVIDAATKQIVRELLFEVTGVGHAYNSPDGRYQIITNYGNNRIAVVDTASWEIVTQPEIGGGRMGHAAFTRDGRYAYISNDGDGVLYKFDMAAMQVVGEVATNGSKGGGQALNVWTDIFEELPHDD